MNPSLPSGDPAKTIIGETGVAMLDRRDVELQSIIDAIPALVAYVNRDLRYERVNREYQRWFGLTPADLQGQHVQTVLGEKGFAAVKHHIEAALAGRPVHYTEQVDYPHGGSRWIEVRYAPDLDRDGRTIGFVLLAQDISERKRAEAALADSAARYRFLAETMPQIVWTARPDGAVDYVNDLWIKETGLSAAKTLGFGWIEALHPEDRQPTRERWEAAAAAKTQYEIENRLWSTRDGRHHWHLCRAKPFLNERGEVVQWVGTSTDIDDLRQAYTELSVAREQLKRHADDLEKKVAERTASLSEANAQLEAFTYSVSHDLRTPLQFIQGFSEALAEDKQNTLSVESQDYLRRISRSASRMDVIIQDLLTYSRLARAELKFIDLPLEQVVNEVLMHHQAAIQASKAAITIDAPLPRVWADHTGTFQAVSNLVSNALKFVAPGQPPSIRIFTELGERATRFCVQDRGIGIKPEHQERIFRMFERLHSPSEYPGTGIGLSLVKKAVARISGKCGVISAPGQGSTFWIDFPSVPQPDGLSHAQH